MFPAHGDGTTTSKEQLVVPRQEHQETCEQQYICCSVSIRAMRSPGEDVLNIPVSRDTCNLYKGDTYEIGGRATPWMSGRITVIPHLPTPFLALALFSRADRPSIKRT